MTPLQILRTAVADGAMLTIIKREDGYHVAVTATDGAGGTARREVAHARLEQALFLVVKGEAVGEVAAG
ncbi:MAG: hypothetical protein KDE24_31950 [Caldilinea sp.]|nr:hypothetical protein [Caldilinea sp.]